MGGGRIRAHADDLRARVLEVLVLIAERAGLLRAAGRVVLRIEVEDDRLFPAIVAEANGFAAGVGEREVRCRVTRADARGTAEEVEKPHGWGRYLASPVGSRRRQAATGSGRRARGRVSVRDGVAYPADIRAAVTASSESPPTRPTYSA